MKKHLVICDCGLSEHQIIAQYDPDESEPLHSFLYLDVHLANHDNFFKRAWTRIKYAFGYRSQYGAFDEIVVNKSEAIELRTFVFALSL